MKSILFVFLIFISLQALACPNISGSYYDEDGNLLAITQDNCLSTTWTDSEGTTTLYADNIERIVEQDGKDKAFGKARFTKVDFVLELRVVFGSDVPNDYPKNILTSYRIDKKNNLVEKIETIYGTSYLTFRRVK